MHARMMREAIRQASLAQLAGDVPVGCVVALAGEIIAAAHNEREATGDPTAHAEVLAIRRAAKALGTRRLSECTLYVTLEPCPMCAGTIVMAGLKDVYYGASDTRMGCAGSLYSLPEDEMFGGVILCHAGLLADECEKQLKQFFERIR